MTKTTEQALYDAVYKAVQSMTIEEIKQLSCFGSNERKE